jgi:NodT family efflux transporter outer membrane factor (OMF) lipoprotein
MLRLARLACLTPIAAVLAACALQAPPKPEDLRAQTMQNVQVPSAWATSGGAAGAVSDGWLAAFKDAQLDAIVREALVYNTDLLVAAGRIEQAAGFAKLSGATLYPAVNLLARGGGKLGGDNSGLSGVGLFAGWEIDIWGRARSAGAAGTAQYDSVVADAAYARQSIAAAVAKSWYLAIEARLQRTLAEEIVRSSEQTVGLAQERLRIGRGDEYDVTLAQANLATYRDAARQVALAETQALRSLEILLGRYPAAAIEVAAALPPNVPVVPVGLASELLERRPDVIAAQRRVAAAFYQVSEAKAARLPRIALTAGLTSISSELFVLKEQDNPVVSLGANITAPIFNGWALQSQVEIRTAAQKVAAAEYAKVALRAFADVEAALAATFAADEREALLASAVQSNARALEIAQSRLRIGSGDLRAVLQQNVALSAARASLVRVQTDRLVQRVNLNLALGGSFDPKPAEGPVASTEAAGMAVDVARR